MIVASVGARGGESVGGGVIGAEGTTKECTLNHNWHVPVYA